MYKKKFLSLLLVFSLVICGTMGTGKGAKAEENVTTEESGKNPQVESGSVEEEFEDDLAGEDEDIDGDYASFDNKDAIKNIEPGQSVSFTLIATCDEDNVDIFEYTLYEMIKISEELEGDDEWEEEYEEDVLAQYYFERSDFASDEAYEEYLIRHEAWKNTKTYVLLNS